MSQQDRLEELLVEWGVQREQGREVAAETLCVGCPELTPALRRLIDDLKTTDWLERVVDEQCDGLALPEFNTYVGHSAETILPPSTIGLPEFKRRLVESGLVSSDDIQSLPGDSIVDARAMANCLIAERRLTRFQASELLSDSDRPLVLDCYVLLSEIGSGGMGTVYKALHQQMERVVALKVLPKESVDSSEKVLRFHREVKALGQLEHPNIVTAFDAREDQGIHFLVMSYVEGRDLNKVINQQGRLTVSKAVNYVTQAARGLDHAHRHGIVHRDIKPANLLIDRQGCVKILDMGLARVIAEPTDLGAPAEELTSTGVVMGTIAYLAPEQALDTRQADPRSDVYSLGCTLYHLLTGKPIYVEETLMQTIMAHQEAKAPTLRDSNPNVPEELDAVYQKMVAKAPSERYQSMAEVISALDTIPTDPELTREASLTDANSFAMAETVTFIGSQEVTVVPESKTARLVVRKWPVAAAAVLALVALVWIACELLIKVETEAGTVTLNIDQAGLGGAVVSIDGKKEITIVPSNNQPTIEVTPDAKTHILEVKMAGFHTFTKDFSFTSGPNQTIQVKLDPIEPTPNDGRTVVLPGETKKRRGPSLREMLLSNEWNWSEPKPVGPPVESPYYDFAPEIMPDGLTLYISTHGRLGGYGHTDLWVAHRETLDSPWSKPRNVNHPVNTKLPEEFTTVSADQLTLYYVTYDPEADHKQPDILVSTRESIEQEWKPPQPFSQNTKFWESSPFLSADGRTLLFCAGLVIRKCRRDTIRHPWRTPEELPETINKPDSSSGDPWLSEDELVLIFTRSRHLKTKQEWVKQLHVSIRKSKDEDWPPAIPLLGNTTWSAGDSSYCPANRTVYFMSPRPAPDGEPHIWQATLEKSPSPD